MYWYTTRALRHQGYSRANASAKQAKNATSIRKTVALTWKKWKHDKHFNWGSEMLRAKLKAQTKSSSLQLPAVFPARAFFTLSKAVMPGWLATARD